MADKSATIEIAAHGLIQLFNSLDPSPFPERDLDDEVEAYIVSWAKELSPSRRFRIVIHLPGPEVIKAEQEGLRKAISNYFAVQQHLGPTAIRAAVLLVAYGRLEADLPLEKYRLC